MYKIPERQDFRDSYFKKIIGFYLVVMTITPSLAFFPYFSLAFLPFIRDMLFICLGSISLISFRVISFSLRIISEFLF